MALFYLIRHGESVWNAEERLCGRTDVELSDAGRRQAERLGERLRELPPTVIYTSPLRRTLETVEIIAAAIGRGAARSAEGGASSAPTAGGTPDHPLVPSLPRRGIALQPIVDARIVELNYGEWEGKTFAEVKNEDRDLYRRWDADPAREAPPGGETGLAGVDRIVSFLDDLKRRHPGKREHVVIVTHKTVCRLALCHALGLAPSEYRRRLSMENTALNIIEPTEDGWRVVLVNDTSHLARVHSEAASLNGTF